MAEMNNLRLALEEGTKKGYSTEDLTKLFIKFLDTLPTKEANEQPTKEKSKEISKEELTEIITDVIVELGTPANVKGYRYIREAIMYSLMNEVESVTKELYPYIAKKFNTTSSRVERAIRHAIEISWERGDKDVLRKYFKNAVDAKRGKPTNSEFIATIADKLKLQYKLR